MTSDNGGPAFPIMLNDGETHAAPDGMSLRDYFAGQALTSPELNYVTLGDIDLEEPLHVRTARGAYMVADAMLAARKEPTP